MTGERFYEADLAVVDRANGKLLALGDAEPIECDIECRLTVSGLNRSMRIRDSIILSQLGVANNRAMEAAIAMLIVTVAFILIRLMKRLERSSSVRV